MNYQEKLRRFADYLDDRPELAEKLDDWGEYPRASAYCNDWETFQATIATLGGYDKQRYGGSLEAKHTEIDVRTGNKVFALDVNVSGVCERVPVTDEDGEPVMKPRMRYIPDPEGELDPEYEWSCPPKWSDK